MNMAPPDAELQVPQAEIASEHRRMSRRESSEEDGVFMKEEDAAILERGLRRDSLGETPEFTSASEASGKDVPDMLLSDVGDMRDSAGNGSSHVNPVPSRSPLSRANSNAKNSSCRLESIEEADVPLSQLDSVTPLTEKTDLTKPAKVVYRRCLSGDIRQTRHDEPDDASDATPPSVVEELQQSLISELKASSSNLVEAEEIFPVMRSHRSMERLMQEAAQFAEAVGELPPATEADLHEIIEDDEGSSYFDDSGTEEGDELKEEALTENVSPGKVREESKRSASFDRKVNEAAQFFEAVGELPPVNDADLGKIIDDDVSDGESDDEVCMDEATALSMPNTPQATLRRTMSPGKQGEFVEGAPLKTDDAQLRPKCRPQWPFKKRFETSSTFLHKLPDGLDTQDFVYKGICSNPPEITKHGIQRGNYAQLHRKAWLEVSDKYHRYGKHLRLYYRLWERLGFPHNVFFDWLDSKGAAAGEPLPYLDECPRSQLDSDTVLYITNPDVTERYALRVIVKEGTGRGHVVDVDGDPVATGSEGWIFVLRDNVLYGAPKIASVTGHSKQRFHHSSFFGGKAVAAAGIIITDDDGYLDRLYPHSGHYRPGEAHMQRMLFYLHHSGVSLRTFELDTQQIFKMNREVPTTDDAAAAEGNEKKLKKVDSLHLMPALYVASFLAHKARFIDAGILSQIHKIRTADVTSVREALDAVDDGGFWKHVRKDLRDTGE
jgi:hypothetical protein